MGHSDPERARRPSARAYESAATGSRLGWVRSVWRPGA